MKYSQCYRVKFYFVSNIASLVACPIHNLVYNIARWTYIPLPNVGRMEEWLESLEEVVYVILYHTAMGSALSEHVSIDHHW